MPPQQYPVFGPPLQSGHSKDVPLLLMRLRPQLLKLQREVVKTCSMFSRTEQCREQGADMHWPEALRQWLWQQYCGLRNSQTLHQSMPAAVQSQSCLLTRLSAQLLTHLAVTGGKDQQYRTRFARGTAITSGPACHAHLLHVSMFLVLCSHMSRHMCVRHL